MRSERRPWGKGVVAAVVVVMLGGLGLAPRSHARPSAAPAELPPVTLSTTTFRDGEAVTMSGTGCIDPSTGTGAGLAVVLRRPVDGGRGGFGQVVTIQAEVAADGTYSGTGTVQQPLDRYGSVTATITCEPPPGHRLAPPVGSAIASRATTIDVVPPSLPDLTIRAGSQVDLVLPCDVPTSSYGAFSISWHQGPADDIVGLSVQGAPPPAVSPKAGETVTLDVPSTATPGTYSGEARCSVSEGGTAAFYMVTITVLGAGAAAPAESVAGRAADTG
jgi:hypothetical protein